MEVFNWRNPTDGTPDYFNALTNCENNDVPSNQYGFQYAKDGIAYYCIAVYGKSILYREYIQNELKETLTKGRQYCVSFYVNLNDVAQYATDDVGVFFSDTAIRSSDIVELPVTPQISNKRGNFLSDKSKWMLVQGSFFSLGQERCITIGNFNDDANTDTLYIDFGGGETFAGAGYYIDMVSVIPCDSVFVAAGAGDNAIICRGDSTILGSHDKPYYNYSWEPSIGLSNPGIARPKASPTQTTTYYLTVKYFDLSETKDSVTVYVKDCQAKPGFRIYPNPSMGDVTVELINGTFQDARIELTNILGQQVFSADIGNGIIKKHISFSKQLQGLYFAKVWNNGLLLGEEKIVIMK
ncbi:MAG: T9SS type A sorting domain-containing protein [Bacteroidota bacterium]